MNLTITSSESNAPLHLLDQKRLAGRNIV